MLVIAEFPKSILIYQVFKVLNYFDQMKYIQYIGYDPVFNKL